MSKKPKPLTHYLVFAYYNDEQQITVDHVMARDEEAAEKIIYKLRPEILHCSAEEARPFAEDVLKKHAMFQVDLRWWKKLLRCLFKELFDSEGRRY